jgi:hypothetical protein
VSDSNRCNARPVVHGPDCRHNKDFIESAFFIVADGILRHVRSGKDWDCQDECWAKDLAAARLLIELEIERLRGALSESLKLQSHYAKLLNMHDGGKRIGFDSVEAWLERLDAIRKEPQL